MIGEAVRTKINDTKRSIMTGTRTEQSFGDLLRSIMKDTNEAPKTVGISNATGSNSPIAKADGRTLLYALSNSDTDAAASAVVGALGLPITDNNIKTAADRLSSAIKLFETADGADKSQTIKLLSDITDKYNELINDLSAQTTASGVMYSRLFSTAARSASDALASAGITVGDNGRLTFDAGKLENADIDGFLGSIATAADAVSTYASSITGSQSSSLLDFLGNDDSSYSTANYYGNLINTMM